MIRAMAAQWHRLNPSVDEDDLYQEGLIALNRAVQLHDQSKEGFTSYLWMSVKRRMRRWTAWNRDTIRVPESALMKSRWSNRVVSMSLGMQTTEDGGVLEDIVAAPAADECLSDDEALINLMHAAIAKLKPVERWVITALFYEEKKPREVAVEIGFTRQRIEQIRNKALNRLSLNRGLKAA
jgi:RNA polymerase sigma factor (sigma-70 family)